MGIHSSLYNERYIEKIERMGYPTLHEQAGKMYTPNIPYYSGFPRDINCMFFDAGSNVTIAVLGDSNAHHAYWEIAAIMLTCT